MKNSGNEALLNLGLLWLRVLMGAGIAYHGAMKIFGGMMGKLTEGVAGMGFPFPEFFAWSAALAEFAGGLLIVLGLYTRPAALFVLVTMIVAAFFAHAKDPFSAKELALAYGVMAAALLMTGPGRWSIDSHKK
jgi:putative oxidoreductase